MKLQALHGCQNENQAPAKTKMNHQETTKKPGGSCQLTAARPAQPINQAPGRGGLLGCQGVQRKARKTARRTKHPEIARGVTSGHFDPPLGLRPSPGLPLDPPGSPWLPQASPGSSWLLLAPHGFSWLPLASPGSPWLFLTTWLFLAPPGPWLPLAPFSQVDPS